MADHFEIKKLGMVGAGSMGGGMSLLFAENGVAVSLNDPSEETMDGLLKTAEEQGLGSKLSKHSSYDDLCKSLDSPKVFVFSLPHGSVGDSVLDGLHPYLEPGDIIIDASNENWENTQRRQGKSMQQGVYYIGMGVSGGYQAARRGPSMCPGGTDDALKRVMPLLEKVAAKDEIGTPCVGKAGEGGAGHYVKMVHNGIEHGMMSAISEAWQIMTICLGMSYDEVGKEFERWNADGELKGTFLVSIGIQICQQRDDHHKHVLAGIKDKVVQDIDGSEGTGIWTNEEAIRLHIPAPTLTTAHFIRIASADRAQREHVQQTFEGHFPVSKINHSESERSAFLEDLRLAVYAACLASYVQGINIIDAADAENKWKIDLSTILQIWRAGCIIQADAIAGILTPIWTVHGRDRNRNLLYEHKIAEELKKGFGPLKKVVFKGVEANAVIPSLSATLEYLKYSGNTILPTSFYEAELDYFGKHMFDLTSDAAGKPVTGKHHFEWKKA
ncbi:6-phosphogluconate dehydrogenase [Lasallia pustulata]|uniref:6-phosphogluconate dehydrogenase, decarboxylating n=1 Tax=Lasallia pustulata TaxID=136370 RepID=A0A1W5CWW4_9LECA|nr:6-phosphogluconate dehydrogenase [Lasallia pustulata]